MTRRCLSCHRLVELKDYDQHVALHRKQGATGTSWNGKRDRTAQARFRKQILALSGEQCTALVNGGRRCPATTQLQAHHREPGNDDPTTGALLCPVHHRQADRWAR